MKPIVSLRSLPEPAYILLGGLLPDNGEGELRVLRSPASVLLFEREARPILEFFSSLRSQSEAEEFATEHDSPGALETLVTARTLVRLPADDELGVRVMLGPLCVRITAPAHVATDGETVLLRLNERQAVAIGSITATVLSREAVQSLEESIYDVARQSGLDKNVVWRSVMHDLTGVLLTGAGHLAEVSAP